MIAVSLIGSLGAIVSCLLLVGIHSRVCNLAVYSLPNVTGRCVLVRGQGLAECDLMLLGLLQMECMLCLTAVLHDL